MKKILLFALMSGLLNTTAMAESKLTLAGRLDVGYGVSNGGDFSGKGQSKDGKFQQWSSGKSPSFFSIRGTEGVNSNLNVFFQLEGGVNLETGAWNGFNRDAFVGVSGQLGELRFGRQKSAFNYTMGKFDLAGRPNHTSSVNMAGVTAQTPKYGRSTVGRFDSALIYMSPRVKGFKATAGLMLKNDDVRNTGAKAKSIYELVGEYRYQKFDIGVAYRSKLRDEEGEAWGVSARYDFGPMMLAAGYFDNHLKDDGKGYFLGLRVPVGSWRLGAQIAKNTDAVRKNTELKPLAWEAFAYYDLSKRSHLYFIYGGLDNDAKAYQSALRDYSFAAGIVHRF